MRNVFVLVSLCIGLASGFIVPSGSQKETNDDGAHLAEYNIKQAEHNIKETKGKKIQGDHKSAREVGMTHITIVNSTHKNNLESNHNRINNDEIYEQDSKKPNNVNERSFIYINQKFKKPIINHLPSSQDLLKETLISDIDETSRQLIGFLKPKDDYVQKAKATIKSFYYPPALQNKKAIIIHKDIALNENKYDNSMNQLSTRVDEQQEYVELLKRPRLRPAIAPDQEDMKWSLAETVNNEVIENKDNRPILSVLPRFPIILDENYRYPTPIGYQRSIPQINKPEELGAVRGDKMNTVKSDSAEAGKLLDQYFTDSLENQITNERINVMNNCSHKDCFSKTRKQYLNGRNSEPDCKCGHKFIVKQRESNGFNSTDSTDTENVFVRTSTEISTTSSSSELPDYSDILSDEMHLRKLISDD